MLVLTWNIQKRVRQIDAVVAALISRRPDIVTLQEVAGGALAPLLAGLQTIGLVHALPSLANGKGNLIASRWPLRVHPAGWAGTPPELPFPELLTGATIDTPQGELEVVTAHIPNGSGHGEKKLAHFRALARYLGSRAPRRCVLTGDFNSPRSESADGTVLCFGGSYKNRGQAWENAEQAIVARSSSFGMRDVFRDLHGYAGDAAGAYSHETTKHRRRFDHIFASKGMKVEAVEYEMSWLDEKLSDHAALWARFATPAVSCSGCGAARTEDAGVASPRPPCPTCGGVGIAFSAEVSEELTVHDDLVSAYTPVQQRDWRERWLQMQRGLGELLALRDEPVTGDAVRAQVSRVHLFFGESYAFKEALGKELSPAISKHQVEAAIKSSPDLALVIDLANTDKHGGMLDVVKYPPKSGHAPRVGMASVVSSGTEQAWNVSLPISHGPDQRDALDVAVKAVDAWRKLLTAWKLI